MLDKKQNDYFSSFMTGEEMINKHNQERYESTPGYTFDYMLNEVPFISLVKVDDDTGICHYALHSPEIVWGLVRFDMGQLSPLDRLTSQSHCRHIRSISTKEDVRGFGFFKLAMEKIIEIAEDSEFSCTVSACHSF